MTRPGRLGRLRRAATRSAVGRQRWRRAVLAVERTVACSANVVVLLPTIRAFRCGCMLDVEVVPKQGTLSKDHWWNLHMSVYGGFLGKRRGARLPNKLLRLDVRYADGTKATSAARAGWVARNASMSAVLTVAQSVMAVAEEDRKIARSRIVVRWPSIMECWRAECRHGVPGSARSAHARRASRLLAATLPAYQRAVSHRHLAGRGPSKHASGQGRKHWLIRDARPDHREKSGCRRSDSRVVAGRGGVGRSSPSDGAASTPGARAPGGRR